MESGRFRQASCFDSFLKEEHNMADNNRDALRPYLADMAAVEKHILEALERQHKDDDIRQFPNAHQWLDRTMGILKQHVNGLEDHLKGFPGGGAASTVKEAVTGVLGTIAGLYDKVRKDTASRALRDDYTALSLAVISYTMLHTTALGLRQGASAELALRNLKDLTPLLVELSQIVPHVVLRELSFEGYEVETSLAQNAVRNTQEAWSSEHTSGGKAGAGAPVGSVTGSAGSYTQG
jgi:ferritin-like metal-binding protein YciE